MVEGISGRVPMLWSIEPRFGYGSSPPRVETRLGIPVAVAGRDAVAICSWSAGEPERRQATM